MRVCSACRAEQECKRRFDVPDRPCRTCGGRLPASFFSQGETWCHACKSEYAQLRRSSLLIVVPATKQCRRCRNSLPAASFYPCSVSRTGLSSYCKECDKALAVISRRENAQVQLPAAVHAESKLCTSCRAVKPRAAFWSVPAHEDGLKYVCKECMVDKTMKRRKARKMLLAEDATDPQRNQR